jgi:hypothetical protein
MVDLSEISENGGGDGNNTRFQKQYTITVP